MKRLILIMIMLVVGYVAYSKIVAPSYVIPTFTDEQLEFIRAEEGI